MLTWSIFAPSDCTAQALADLRKLPSKAAQSIRKACRDGFRINGKLYLGGHGHDLVRYLRDAA